MGQRYYRIEDDVSFPDRWHLWEPRDGRGEELWGWEFMEARLVSDITPPVSVSIQQPGLPLDFTEVLAIPIVTLGLAEAVSEVVGPALQRIDAKVEGSTERYEVINVLTALSCVDESHSEIMYWTESDGRPDKVGQYRMVRSLVLNQARLGDADLFRLAEYPVILLCSELLKTRLEVAGFTGLRFREIPIA